MFGVKKEIYIDKRRFDGVSGLRSRLMDIVRRNYTEYNVSREAIIFYVTGRFNFNRGMEGSIVIKEDDSSYCVTVRIKQMFLLPLLIFIIVPLIVISSSFGSFDMAEFAGKLILLSLVFFPILLLRWLVFYIFALAKLKDFTESL